MPPTETTSASGAEPAAKPASIEDRIQAALAPAEPLEPTGDADEAIRESPERQDSGAPAPAEPEASAAPGQPEDGGKSADEGEGERQEPDAIEIGTLADLAKHLDVEAADLYGITVPLEVEGQRLEMSLGEWKDKVKASLDAEKVAEQRKELADERQAAETRLASQRQQVEQSFAEAARLTEVAEKRLLADLEGIDWAQLRSDNPAEWAARQQEMQQRQAQIQEAKNELAANWQKHAETQQAEAAEELTKHLQREQEALFEAIPDWRNTDKYESERKALAEYLSGQGFTDEEIANAADHRLIVMARKAQMYDQQTRKQSVAKKKVAKVGKRIVKPGATAGKEAARQDAEAALRAQLRKSGSVNDAAALIAARNRR